MSGAARAGPARLAALALLTCSLWPARADNASQEYYTALINVTVQEPGRGAPLTFRIDRGRYGLDSPKAEVRGQVLAPLPIHGGECRAAESGGRARGARGRATAPTPGEGAGARGRRTRRPHPGRARSSAPPAAPGPRLGLWCSPACSAAGGGAPAAAGGSPPLLGGLGKPSFSWRGPVYGRTSACEFAGTVETKAAGEERTTDSWRRRCSPAGSEPAGLRPKSQT